VLCVNLASNCVKTPSYLLVVKTHIPLLPEKEKRERETNYKLTSPFTDEKAHGATI
jgi:hypothetical protein